MKLPRKGILIRLAIYLPLIIGLVIWRAFFAGGDEAPAAPEPPPPAKFQTITLEEAKAMGLELPEELADTPPAETKPAE